MDKISKKRGSIEIIVISAMVIFFMFVFFSIYFLYSKINAQVYKVKEELPNILQNSIFAFDREELAYNNFVVDENVLKEKIETLIDLNYNNVKVVHISYDEEKNRVNITVEIDLNLDKWNIKDVVSVSESVKLNMMELEN